MPPADFLAMPAQDLNMTITGISTLRHVHNIATSIHGRMETPFVCCWHVGLATELRVLLGVCDRSLGIVVQNQTFACDVLVAALLAGSNPHVVRLS